MISVIKYSIEKKDIWNKFNLNSKNSLFMFDRNYMDYHKERFKDHSLMFYDDERLVAILPLNEQGELLFSHGGLTYGGFIVDERMKQHTMNECFLALIDYAKNNNFICIEYKIIPHIYHMQPSEEDRYALFLNGGQLIRVEASTVINLKDSIKMTKGRKAQISRAKREGVIVKELTEIEDFEHFIDIENKVLSERHNTRAVHTADELKLLHSRFPDNIHLFGAIKNDEIIAGTVIFEYEQVVHTQYMAANNIARKIGALDLVINTIIERYKSDKLWLDFGISTENGGKILNDGLIAQKEGFGGRTQVYERWQIVLE